MKRSVVQASAFECLVVTPYELGLPVMAIAGAHAGAVGILDFEFSEPASLTSPTLIERLRWLLDRVPGGGRVGVRVSPAKWPDIAEPLRLLGASGFDVILTETPLAPVIQMLSTFSSVRTFLEIRAVEPFLNLPNDLPIDGVIACGNENGGIVGEETTFILLQRLARDNRTPVYARGGIGVHIAAGCRAIGARGVVLDDQLLLTEETPLPPDWRRHLVGCTGQDTVVFGQETNWPCRVLNRPALSGVARLRAAAEKLESGNSQPEDWKDSIEKYVGWRNPAQAAWPIGQSIGLAEVLAQRYGTTGRVVHAVLDRSAESVQLAQRQRAIAAESPLARSHGTRYPIVQGPMTRVSDRPEFALAVARAGALPLIALALLSGPQARPILEATRDQLGDLPWGVGILGFVPPELRREQIAEILRVKPKVVLIAGGRADIAKEFEQEGIATYLHTPAPSLLRRFLNEGMRRFVFEGRECGGHVGPLCSCPLWESMIEILLESIPSDETSAVHILFAGGIHDANSTAFISAMAAPLAARGMRFGVLMGTAYLFTEEAVKCGAIVPGYQREAIVCDKTVLLKTGLGHLVRVAETPFATEFERQRKTLLGDGSSADEMKVKLEGLMLGRLRLASKGILRENGGELIAADDERQARQGVYMVGQVVGLRSSVCKMADLHRDVCGGGVKLLGSTIDRQGSGKETSAERDGVAIIGIGLLLPGAKTRIGFWRNILDGVGAIQEVPADRWDVQRVFDPNMSASDKTYSKWGGFIEDIPFDPLQHRIPPTVMRSICTSQLLALEVTRWALADAGYADCDFDRANTGVILATDDSTMLSEHLRARATLPYVLDKVDQETLNQLPEWSGETLPGVLSNVVAGRVANEFDLGGPNFVVNAACASSLVALDLAVRELQQHRSNMVITGGVDTTQTPFFYVAFSKTQALSPRGIASVFDQSADGIVLSEGACIVVLKRLEDARRDGDRIYAVIRGTGCSSDGKGRGITVPTITGERRAIQRAMHDAQITAETIGLYEAHATGTPLGDRTELDTLVGILKAAGAPAKSCAIGSIKSLIGHTKLSAGVVGMAKAAFALYHRVLPSHFGLENPVDSLSDPDSPIYSLRQPRPWLAHHQDLPRRAAVSAFGFGGTNSHLILESNEAFSSAPLGADDWPSELLLFSARNEQGLLTRIRLVIDALRQGAEPRLRDLAFTLASEAENISNGLRLSLVCGNLDGLKRDLPICEQAIRGEQVALPRHISFSRTSEAQKKSVALLFPGQGSHYLNMAWEPALYLPELRASLELWDRELFDRYSGALSDFIFPPGVFSREAEATQQRNLSDTHRAQPAIGAISAGFIDFLNRLGIQSDVVAGHSYGELTALHAAGVLSRRTFLKLSEARGRAMMQCCDSGGMVSVYASRQQVEAVLAGMDGVTIANHNAPRQTVISGTSRILDAAIALFIGAGIRSAKLSVAGAFHSPSMIPASEPWSLAIEEAELRTAQIPVYSNLDGMLYPTELPGIRARMRDHLLRPVEFFAQIMSMYADGVQTFIEVGPSGVLRSLVDAILEGQPYTCVSLDPERGRLRGLLSSLGKLAVLGLIARPARLFDDRPVEMLPLDRLVVQTKPAPLSPTAWFVNGSNVRPAQTKASTKLPSKPVAAVPSAEDQRERVPTQAPLDSNISVQSSPLPTAADHLRPDLVSAYTSYQEAMAQFLRMQEKALNEFLALAHSDQDSRQFEDIPQASLLTLPDVKPSDVQNGQDRPSLFQEDAQVSTVKLGRALRQDRIEDTVSDFRNLEDAASVPAARNLAADSGREMTAKMVETEDVADAKDFSQELVAIVSEFTGYPADMLGLELDMESELGVDSLRRMEIAEACLARLIKEPDPKASVDIQDSLIRARTLKQMISVLQRASLANRTPAPIAPAGPEFTSRNRKGALRRYVPRQIARPLDGAYVSQFAGSVLIIEDQMGVARFVADKFSGTGAEVILISQSEAQDRTILKKRLTSVSKLGAIVHLAALSPAQMPDTFEEWKHLTQVQAKSLFRVLSLSRSKLLPGDDVSLRVVAASLMGGRFGRQEWHDGGLPIGGSSVGLLKSLALEWPGIVAKSVDFDSTEGPAKIADAIVAEALHTDRDSEIGYPEGVRAVFVNSSLPLALTTSHYGVKPAEDWVVLATGGARGITAEIVHKLLKPGMTVIATGRSEFNEHEATELAGARTATALRNHFIANVPEGITLVPRQVETWVKQIERDREIRHNLTRMSEGSVNVIYKACDMSDSGSVQSLLKEIYTTYGRIDAVIHGAGVIEDKLLVEKAWDSFDRVFDTKVDSAYLLARFLHPSQLKLLAFMGSVSGRIGNTGQTDYAAANEVLNRFAWWLSYRWTNTRVVSINWGPWASQGMATGPIQASLKKRGIAPIAIEDGCGFFEEEIAFGTKEDAEVLAGEGPWTQ
jgi:acyl transferase domain-containing protein/NAD(P)H-dependent flavin oxidoreductase YrpB (nitropropane dioxygenase family)/NAD(P)-dependent dehydrogenase (short-subunit alcohol dehydrogenase family)